MPRKKSTKIATKRFDDDANEILDFAREATRKLSTGHVSIAHDQAIIRLYRAFETLMLDALVAAINSNTATISARTGIEFPKHLTDEVCLYLVAGSGYFDFKGRDGLIQTLKKYLPDTHFLVTTIKKPSYKQVLEKLSTLRNYAAHDSDVSKKAALTAVGLARMGSAGSWLKRQERLDYIVGRLLALTADLRSAAPY